MKHAEIKSLLDAIVEALPAVPDKNAPCPYFLCSQSECVYCQRIIRAYEAIQTLRKIT